MTNCIVKFMPLGTHDGSLRLPAYETALSAGVDLRACLDPLDRAAGLKLAPLQRSMVGTGLAMSLPQGFEAQVRPRSGLAARHGVTVLNSPGTIDADYRGEIRVLLINLGAENFHVSHGDRIAQMVFAPVSQAEIIEADALDETARGTGGFGSTGRS